MNRTKTAMAGAALLPLVWISSASAVDLSRCLALKEDCRRVACYDELARRAGPAQPSAAGKPAMDGPRDLEAKIMARCEESFGFMGPAAVVMCVKRDLPAARELQRMKSR